MWDMSDRDLVPPHELVTVPETGGMVLGVWREGDPELAGFVFGWGGVTPNWAARSGVQFRRY